MERPKEQPMMVEAKRLAKQLYKSYKREEKDGKECGGLLIEWTKENLYGHMVEDAIPVFQELWQLLKEGKHNKKNTFDYGDCDVSTWFETTRTGRWSSYRKVIVTTRHCSCADDNTHIFILDEIGEDWIKFMSVTVWPRQKSNRGYSFGDDRDIKLPSLNTYRKKGFKYGYGDGRDEGHCFVYDSMTGRVDKPHWHENALTNALWTLRTNLEAIKSGDA